MLYISPENAAERRRELRRRAESARLARQARQGRRREGAADGGRPGAGRRASGRLGRGRLGRGRLGRGRLGRGWRRVAGALAEGARVQRRAAVLNASLDRYLPHPHQPPATYQEFLARTAGPLLCEPPATARWRGHTVG